MSGNKRFCSVLLSFFLIFSAAFTAPVYANDGYSDYIDSVIKMAKDRYYRDISKEELLEGALRGIFDSMDDYTVYYSQDEAESFFTSIEGNYQGIGVEIMEVPEGAIVTRVFSDSPAEGAGILPDDIIVKVDGVDVKGLTVQDIANLVRGEKGSYVEIGIMRNYSSEILYFSVERNVVNISPVTWEIYGNAMYIKLEQFSSNSAHFFEQALKEADNNGINKIILDLRNNPGGEVGQAVSIARMLVRKGIITTLDFKSEEMNDTVYRSYLVKPKYVTAVLVNGNTASASEILASAIQDSRDGVLVGTKTYGKGVFQNMYPILKPEAYKKYRELYGESIVDGYEWMNKHDVQIYQEDILGWTKITTGHYLTRNGKMIDGTGLFPDFPVEDYEVVNDVDVNSIKRLDSSSTVELNGVGNDVYNAEKILRIKGYEIDEPDNILDAKTADALKKYQAEKKIKVTGVLDDTTKEKLNEDIYELRIAIDKPFAKAVELLGLLD